MPGRTSTEETWKEFQDIAGNSVELHAGFGKWLLGGESRQLNFDLSQSPTAIDDLSGTVELLNTANQPIFRQNFEVSRRTPTSGG